MLNDLRLYEPKTDKDRRNINVGVHARDQSREGKHIAVVVAWLSRHIQNRDSGSPVMNTI